MCAYGLLKGHLWIQGPDGPYWADTKQPITQVRVCPRCREGRTSDMYDWCLGKLPGVVEACCGHGEEEGYIKFRNGVIIRGHFQIDTEEEEGGH